jgi:hypothetical protein
VSSFTTPLYVEVLDKLENGRVTARLIAGFSYDVGELGSGEAIMVPAGFITDFSSVPWGLWNFEPPLGRAGKASVVHDLLYRMRGVLPGRIYSRQRADGIFREALGVLGVPAWKATILWAGVRLGGSGAWAP